MEKRGQNDSRPAEPGASLAHDLQDQFASAAGDVEVEKDPPPPRSEL